MAPHFGRLTAATSRPQGSLTPTSDPCDRGPGRPHHHMVVGDLTSPGDPPSALA